MHPSVSFVYDMHIDQGERHRLFRASSLVCYGIIYLIVKLLQLVHMETYTLSKIPSCKPIIIPIKVKDCDYTSIDADTKTLKKTFKQLGYAEPEVFNQDSDRDTILNQLLNIRKYILFLDKIN